VEAEVNTGTVSILATTISKYQQVASLGVATINPLEFGGAGNPIFSGSSSMILSCNWSG
jgi:hypothetical protein